MLVAAASMAARADQLDAQEEFYCRPSYIYIFTYIYISKYIEIIRNMEI